MIDVVDFTKNFFGDFFGFNSIIRGLEIDKAKLVISNQDLQSSLKYVTDSDLTNKEKIIQLQKAIDKFNAESEFEKMITNKIPKTERYYMRYETDAEYSVDVRNFFMIKDGKLPVVTGVNNDEKALNGLKKVKSLVTYTPDKTAYNYDEYWAYPYQTLKRGKGDCEDGAILLANILVKSGIPWYRVRVCAGSVNGGGHAYCVYCRETDNEWVVLDWCYWYNSLPVKDRPTHKEMRNYFDKEKNFYVWFSWDLYNVYAKEELTGVASEFFR